MSGNKRQKKDLSSAKKEDDPVNISLPSDWKRILKENWHLGVLALILILGFFLRAYHLDYPLIDYHNMKEAHTLMEARHFYEEGDYFTNRYDYQTSLDNPEGIHGDNFPLYGWMIALLWKITGINLIVPRLLTILFSLVVIVFTYLVTKELFKREDISIFSAFFVCVCPLFIFFGRRVFYDIPALMFSMIAVYYFLIWKKTPQKKYFIFFICAMTLAALSKMVYLIYLLPIAAIFPYGRIFDLKSLKKYFRQYILVLILPVCFIAFTLITKNEKVTGILSRITNTNQINEFFSWGYWKTIYLFAVTDNFSKIGFYIMLIGLILSLFYIKRETNRFIGIWLLSIFPYAFIIGWMVRGHNYYQMPFVPAAAILISYALLFMTRTAIPKLKSTKLREAIIITGIIIFFGVFMYPQFKLSTTRQFDTQFFGLDVAGEFIKENSKPDEKIFGSGHQETAVYWYANRYGVETPQNLTELKMLEEQLNFRWVFVYQWGFDKIRNNKEVWKYLTENYGLRQVGILKSNSNPMLYYLVLEKGGSFNESMIDQYISNKPMQSKIYDLTTSNVEFLWVNI